MNIKLFLVGFAFFFFPFSCNVGHLRAIFHVILYGPFFFSTWDTLLMNDMLAPESQPLTEHMTRGKLNDGERGVMKCDMRSAIFAERKKANR